MKRFSKTFGLILTSVILSLFVSCAVFAGDYVEWNLTTDGQTLTGGGNTYEYYGTYNETEYEITRVLGAYYYENNAWFDGSSYSVRSCEKNGDIFMLSAYEKPSRLYVTPKGKKVLDAFFNGENLKYKIWTSRVEAAEFEGIVFELLQKKYQFGDNFQTLDVTELKHWNSYELTMHDELFFFTRAVGAIHIDYSGQAFFIDYESLGNQYFDADGNFSFRKGTVEALVVDQETLKYINETKSNAEYLDTDYEWEDSGIYYSEEEALSLTPVFYIGLIILGFVFPLPFFVCGLIFPHIKKFGKPKYWYIMSATSAAWILASTVFTIIVLMAQ